MYVGYTAADRKQTEFVIWDETRSFLSQVEILNHRQHHRRLCYWREDLEGEKNKDTLHYRGSNTRGTVCFTAQQQEQTAVHSTFIPLSC